MNTTRAKVRISGGDAIGITKREDIFYGDPQDAFNRATSYAQGYAFALCDGKYGLDMQTSKDPHTDGYMWWQRGGELKVEVLNMNNEPVKTHEDL